MFDFKSHTYRSIDMALGMLSDVESTLGDYLTVDQFRDLIAAIERLENLTESLKASGDIETNLSA